MILLPFRAPGVAADGGGLDAHERRGAGYSYSFDMIVIDLTLDDVTMQATGGQGISATISQTLEDVTLEAQALVGQRTATLIVTLDDVTLYMTDQPIGDAADDLLGLMDITTCLR
jgi:hypothetical protein